MRRPFPPPPIGESRKEANAIKRSEPITVVIGKTTLKQASKGLSGHEYRSQAVASDKGVSGQANTLCL